jgi:hypothetical protein
MATLLTPDFKLTKPNTGAHVPDTLWWLWLVMRAHVGNDLELGGIYANKSGFHNTREGNSKNYPGNYSIRDKINQFGPKDMAAAIDLTFRSAQSGKYTNIDKYTSRLLSSALNKADPRLDLFVFEFYGQADNDVHVEGYNEYKEEAASSDTSHLWHLHISAIRGEINDWWGVWALYTVLIGLTAAQWRASLPQPPKPTTPPKPPAGEPNVPNHTNGAHEVAAGHRGTDVLFVQRFIGSRAGTPDGVAGAAFTAGVRWYQEMRDLDADGIVGPKTWKAMGY